MTAHHRTASWAAVTRVQRPRIEATLPRPCADCGRPVTPGQKWQVAHLVPVSIAKRMGWTVQQINDPSNLGASHTKAKGQKACNQIAGGKLGAQVTNRKRQDAKRMPSW